MNKRIAININFDSFSECFKLRSGEEAHFVDPCYFKVMDRFLKIAEEYKAPVTIYVIGKDLENPRYADAVRKWHSMGHEIGNHSYSHSQSFNRLSQQLIEDEVSKAHFLIQNTVGEAPVGFVSPSWASFENYLGILSKYNYLYDASLAPSWMLILINFVLRLKSPGAKGMIPWIRPDWQKNMFGRRNACYIYPENIFEAAKLTRMAPIVELPLPTATPFRVPLWHTIGLLLPDWAHRTLIRWSVSSSNEFYYLFHPSDFVNPSEDLNDLPGSLHGVFRMDIPFAHKERKIRMVFEELQGMGRFSLMKDLALEFSNTEKVKDLLVRPPQLTPADSTIELTHQD